MDNETGLVGSHTVGKWLLSLTGRGTQSKYASYAPPACLTACMLPTDSTFLSHCKSVCPITSYSHAWVVRTCTRSTHVCMSLPSASNTRCKTDGKGSKLYDTANVNTKFSHVPINFYQESNDMVCAVFLQLKYWSCGGNNLHLPANVTRGQLCVVTA